MPAGVQMGPLEADMSGASPAVLGCLGSPSPGPTGPVQGELEPQKSHLWPWPHTQMS